MIKRKKLEKGEKEKVLMRMSRGRQVGLRKGKIYFVKAFENNEFDNKLALLLIIFLPQLKSLQPLMLY